MRVHVCMCTLCSGHVLLKQQFFVFCNCVSLCVYVPLHVRACTLTSEVDAGSLSQCYQDHREAWMLQEAHADVARCGNGLFLPTINNHIQNTSTLRTFLFTRRLFHGLFYYKWPHLELPAAAVMEEARAVDPAGVTSWEKKKKANGRGSFLCESQLNRTCGRVTLKVVLVDSGEASLPQWKRGNAPPTSLTGWY